MTAATNPSRGPRSLDVRESRETALSLVSAENVQHADVPSVLALQAALQHGHRYGIWSTPSKWNPGEHSKAVLNVDLRARIVHFLPDALKQAVLDDDAKTQSAAAEDVVQRIPSPLQRALDELVLVLTRYLLVLRMGPAGIARNKNGVSLDPSNIIDMAYAWLPPMLALALPKMLADHGRSGCLCLLTSADLEGLTPTRQKSALLEVRRMRLLAERGCWTDVPAIGEDLLTVTPVAGAAAAVAEQAKPDPHRPLPDDYVSQMGKCSLWLIQDLAPNLLAIAEEVLKIWKHTDDPALKPLSVQSRRVRALRPLLEDYEWRDHLGRAITEPPFPLRLSQVGKNSNASKEAAEDDDTDGAVEEGDQTQVAWPPRSLTDILGLMHNVQLAHLFVALLSTGARKAEALDWQRDCLEYSVNGMPYANGRTFKLVDRHDGEARDWVLPDVAVQALEQQVRLVALLESIGPQRPVRTRPSTQTEDAPTHLWVQSRTTAEGSRYAPLKGLNAALVAYAKTLGMETSPGGQRLRAHRFRKTVARMCALALTQAPKVLMDVFGHKSIEMTLYYILTDKELQAEVEQVSRELRVMRAKEVIEKMVDAESSSTAPPLGGYGGPAALAMQRAIDVHREGLHRRGEQWGASSVVELAEVLTLQGKAWQVVRKGVMCTKLPGTETGLCNRSKGHPEPSRCASPCDHRLEEDFLREDVDASIAEAVAAYRVAAQDEGSMEKALWAGQIRAHVPRFEDLRRKWERDPTVREVMQPPALEEVPA